MIVVLVITVLWYNFYSRNSTGQELFDPAGTLIAVNLLIYIQGPPIQKFGDGTGLWAGTTEERPRGRAGSPLTWRNMAH